MRKFLLVSSTVCLVLALASPAVGQDEVQAIIDKAIKAAGGEAKLATLKTVTLKTSTTLGMGGVDITLPVEASFSELDRMMFAGDFCGMPMRGVLNTDGCWRKLGDRVEEAHAGGVPSLRKMVFAVRAAEMLLPLKDPAVGLSHGGEGKVGDRATVIVKANHKDHGDVTFYFDKETGLPAKVEARVTFGIDGQERPFECVFADYKEIEGIKHFTKITMAMEDVDDAKVSAEILISDIKPAAKLEENAFAKPE
jgi:hypothetical protein